jgi:hypothetical protein
MKSRIEWLAITGMLAVTFSFANPAAAQSDAIRSLYVSSATVPTNVEGIHTFPAPPGDFNAFVASDEQLAAYGYPPRPDKTANPDHYRLWEQVVSAAKHRWNGDLNPLPVARGRATETEAVPRRETDVKPIPAAATTPQTFNWSGVALTNTLKKWSSSGSFVDMYSLISVPVSQPPIGAGCDNYSELSWMGLDGFTKPAGIQPGAGKAALVGGLVSWTTCSSADAAYYLMIGWDPFYLDTVFAAKPGDIAYAEVTAPPNGTGPSYMFVEDLTTLTYSAFSVPVLSGITFVGNSAEWIVERLCCRSSGYPYPLANTNAIFFDGGAAIKGNGAYAYPGSTAVSTQVITMVDDTGSQIIEEVNQGSSGYEGQHSIFFQTTNCAWAGGCTEK